MITRQTSTAALPRLAGLLKAATGTIRTWRFRTRTRRQLRHLDPGQLRDIGLDEAGRARECAKWFWQV